MKTHIAVGAAVLLLTLGTSGAGSVLSTRNQVESAADEAASTAQTDVTPEMIAQWKATAASTDYIAPKVPI